MDEDPDLKDVQTEEKARGRKRPVLDAAARRHKNRLKQKFLHLLEIGDEQEFLRLISEELGQKPGSDAYRESLKAWRDYRGS